MLNRAGIKLESKGLTLAADYSGRLVKEPASFRAAPFAVARLLLGDDR
jgi:hypothetical protein